jgi:hypothetical protein
MRKLLTFLKMQNPRRAGQGSAGGWLEASSWTRCQPKDPLNPSAPSKFPQARSLGNILALCTTCAWIAPTAIVFAEGSPAWAQMGQIPVYTQPAPSSGPSYAFLGSTDTLVTSGTTETLTVTLNNKAGLLIAAISFYSGGPQPISVVCTACGAGSSNVNLGSGTPDASGSIFTPWSFWSGNIVALASSVNIVVTYPGSIAFQAWSAAAWNASNLTTGFVGAITTQAANSNTINTTSGEFLFAMTAGIVAITGSCNFPLSTVTPTGTRLSTITSPGTNQFSASADWSAPGAHSPFTTADNCESTSYVIGATYK